MSWVIASQSLGFSYMTKGLSAQRATVLPRAGPPNLLRPMPSLETASWTSGGHLPQAGPIRSFLLGSGIQSVKLCWGMTRTGLQASPMMKCSKGKKDETDVQREIDTQARWSQGARGEAF